MRKKEFKLTDIVWDVDEPEDLEWCPDTVYITVNENDVSDLDDENEIRRYLEDGLSDEVGFCHNGFMFEEVK